MKKNLRHFDRERLIWDAPINDKHKLILLAYNSFLGSNDVCWPANSVIEAMTSISESTLKRQLKEMQKVGIIEVASRHIGKSGRGRASNETKINWQTLEDLHKKGFDLQGGVTMTPGGGVTMTPGGGVTMTPGGGVTMTPGGVTMTPGGVTMTPGGVTMTPDLIQELDQLTNSGSDPKAPPLSPPQGGRERERGENFQQPNSQTATITTATANPDQNSGNGGKRKTKGRDQHSATRRTPSKAVRNVERQYPDRPPVWRTGYGVGEYHPDFIGFVQQIINKNNGDRTLADAIAAIENAETQGNFAKLESRFTEFSSTGNGAFPKNPALKYSPLYTAELPSYDDLSDEISKINVALKQRRWGWDNPQIQLWIQDAQNTVYQYGWPQINYQPILGCSNWPDWAIAKLAFDLHSKPNPPP